MADTSFGFLLRKLRERRNLSLRELAHIANTDHAYLHRLEIGVREAPSKDMLAKLLRALKPDRREGDMLTFLTDHPETDPQWVESTLNDPSIPFRDFTAVAGAVYRSSTRPDYPSILKRIRAILDDESAHG